MIKLLVIAQTFPEPRSSAAGSRMMQLIDLFLRHNHKIEFACTGVESEYSEDLSEKGIKTRLVNVNDSNFDGFIQKSKPEIVIFDRFTTEEQFGWRIVENAPNALRILDTEDLHFLRKARRIAVKENRGLTLEDLQSEVAKREIASILRCDLSLIISKAEMKLLKTEFKIDEILLFYLPFLEKKISKNQIETLPIFEERNHFVTIGNFRHMPNLDMILYLKETVWPLIREKIPKAELHVYGAYMPKRIKQLHHSKSGFHVLGRAENVETVMKNTKILLAPLRFGAGLKGKIVDAMRCGTPCVSTKIGMEGILNDLQLFGASDFSPEEIAEEAANLYRNKNRWLQRQQKGFDVINQHFQESDFEKELIAELRNIQENLNHHRQKNFMGSLLLHHSMKSTKYMSKWIEEKNRGRL